jgi:hypothetical protein
LVYYWRVHRTNKVFMLVKLRSAMLICATLSAVSMAPAQAGPVPDQVASLESTSIPKVAIPELLDSQDEPQLTDSKSQQDRDSDDTAAGTATPTASAPIKASGDLSTMVAQLKGSEAGSHELDCLATGIYFESKSEPLTGQLAVGKVIANRAASGGRFPPTYCGGDREDRRSGSAGIVGRQRSVLSCALCVAGLADEASGFNRQSRLLPLRRELGAKRADESPPVFLFPVLTMF